MSEEQGPPRAEPGSAKTPREMAEESGSTSGDPKDEAPRHPGESPESAPAGASEAFTTDLSENVESGDALLGPDKGQSPVHDLPPGNAPEPAGSGREAEHSGGVISNDPAAEGQSPVHDLPPGNAPEPGQTGREAEDLTGVISKNQGAVLPDLGVDDQPGLPELRPTDDLSAAERRELIAAMRPEDAERVPELHEVDVPAELRERIELAMGKYPRIRSASIPALWAVQRHYGWCSPRGMREAAAVMGLTPAYLESVASFYDLFRTTPSGRHPVLVCHNISCWMRGADELVEAFAEAAGVDAHEADHDGAVSSDGAIFLKGFECLGACDMAPMASIDEVYYGPLSHADAAEAVRQLRAGEPVLPAKALRERGAAGGPEPSPDHRVAQLEGR